MRRYLKITFLFTAIFLLLHRSTNALAKVDVSEKSNEVSLTVDCGTGGIIRCGRMLGVKVTVDSNGFLANGTLTVIALSNVSDQVAYSQAIDFTNEQSVKTEFVISLNEEVTGLLVTMKDGNDHVVTDKKIPIETVNYGAYPVIGLLSESPKCLRYLQQFGNKIVNLGSETFPQKYLALDAFDAIVVDEFKLDSLNSTQLSALIEWTAHGGTLVLSGGGKDLSNIRLLEQNQLFVLSEIVSDHPLFINLGIPIYSKEEEEIMDSDMDSYRKDRLSMIQSIKESASQNSFSHSYVGEAIDYEEVEDCIVGHRELYQYSVANSKKIKEFKGCTWLEVIEYQKGTIQFFHFQLSMDTEKVTRGQTALTHLVNSFLSNTNEARRWEEEMGYYNTFPIDEAQNLSSFPKIRETVILPVFIIYLCIIGPGIYLFLKKRKRPLVLWIAVPVVAIVFMGILTLLGKNSRITEPYVKALAMKHYEEDGSVYGTIYSSVLFPQSKNGDLTLFNADAVYYGGFSYPPYYGGELDSVETEEIKSRDYSIDVAMTTQKERIDLKLKRHPVFSEKQMIVTYVDKAQEAESTENILYTGHSLLGTIKNPSTQKLSNCFLYYRGYYVEVDALLPGEKLCIDSQDAVYYPSFNDAIGSNNFISRKFVNLADPNLYKRSITLGISQLIDSKKLNRDHAYLIGVLGEGDTKNPFSEIASNMESCMDTIVYAEIPVITTDKDTLQVPDLLDLAINQKNFRTDYYTQYSYNGSIDATLRFPCGMQPIAINVSDMFYNKEQSSLVGGEFEKISLYNWEKEKYDLIFRLKSGQQVAQYQTEELTAYFREDGIMKVRYEGANGPEGIYQIPVISCSLESADAGN